MKRITVLLTVFALVGSVSYSRENSPPKFKESISVSAMADNCSFDLVEVPTFETKVNLAVGISAPFAAPLHKQEAPARMDAAALFYLSNKNERYNHSKRSASLYRPVARNGIVCIES